MRVNLIQPGRKSGTNGFILVLFYTLNNKYQRFKDLKIENRRTLDCGGRLVKELLNQASFQPNTMLKNPF